jgi:hypothetical protein
MCDYSLKTAYVEAMKVQNPVVREHLKLKSKYEIPFNSDSTKEDCDRATYPVKDPTFWREVFPHQIEFPHSTTDRLYAIVDLMTIKNNSPIEAFALNNKPFADAGKFFLNKYMETGECHPTIILKDGLPINFIVKGGEFKLE